MKILLLALSFFLSFSVFAKTSEILKRDHVWISLISEMDEVRANENFYVGVKFHLQKDWHIYWKNPGDSGTSPRVTWKNTEGVSVGAFDWPAPQKITIDPLANYGYEDEVVLPMIVSVPSMTQKTLALEGDFEWLVCRVECVPGKATLKLEIPIAVQNKESAEAKTLQAYLNKIPKAIHAIKSSFHQVQEQVVLDFNFPKELEKAYFFPFDGTSLQHAASQNFTQNENGKYQLTIPVSDSRTQPLASLAGVLQIQSKGSSDFFQIDPKKSAIMPEKREFFLAMIFAFLGGLILNLMPCVFPVISIKILSLIEITKEDPKAIRRHGWVYTLGVLVSFLILSGVLFVFQALGNNLGWGFQLQSPHFVLAMTLLFFLMGLSLYGFFDVDGAFVNVGGALANRKNFVGTFFTGILAVIVATPCTAPFMGTALGLTLTMPVYLSLVIYLSLGIGLAFPYLVLCYFPPLLRKLPRPGAWMKNLKQFLAFPMFFTALWLVWVLSFQTSSDFLITLLGVLIFILFLFWLGQVWILRSLRIRNFILLILGAASLLYLFKTLPTLQVQAAQEEQWKKYSPEVLEEALKNKKKVFVDFTAAWCLTCQVNKKVVLRREEVLKYFNSQGVLLLVADWTNQDPAITAELKKLGRNSVPVYVYYDSAGAQNILPEILSVDMIYERIQ